MIFVQGAGRLSVVLTPIRLSDPKFVRINLPDDLDAADWDVSVRNLDVPAVVKLGTKLRLGKTRAAQN